MIIVLKGADFSAKNIGKVNLRADLTEKTKNVFSKMTRFGATSEEAWAFDDFYNTLNAAGIWDKIAKLHLPVLGASKDEAFYDIVGEGGYDLIGISDDYMLFNDDGSVSVGTQTASTYPSAVKYSLSTPINYNDCTAIVFSTEGLKEGKIEDTSKLLVGLSIISTFTYLGNLVSVSAGGGTQSYLACTIPTDGYPQPQSYTNGLYVDNSGFFAATHSSREDISGGMAVAFYAANKKALSNTVFTPATKPNSDGKTTEINIFSKRWDGGTNVAGIEKTKMHAACFCITKEALTDEETWAFNDAIDNLMTALGFSGKFKARNEFV